jgi:hypothetical protein
LRALSLALTVACAGSDPGGAADLEGPGPDFALQDVNPASPTVGEPVSPRDHLDQVSAWYFGHAD